MKKQTSIGFKGSLDEDKEHNEDAERIPSPNEIAEETEEKIRNQQEFDKHMEEFEFLQTQNAKYKFGLKILLYTIIFIIFGYLCYCYGAYKQITNNGPYIKVLTVDNKELIIRK